MSPPKILVVVHQPHSTPGRVGEALVKRGYHLDRRCPCQGDVLPESLDDYQGSIVFGGPQSANDDHIPGIFAELRWLESTALPAAKPLLGICLGAQQMARVLGAKVGPDPNGQVEIGYHEITPTGACSKFMHGPTSFYQWHSETFEIPQTAVHLAASDAFPGQAFRYGDTAYAIEFHPEMTLDMINRWCTSETGAPKLAFNGAQPHWQQVRDFSVYRHRTNAWLDSFLDMFLAPQQALA